jgi:hypothetical protein
MYKYGRLKLVKVIYRRERRKRENNRGDTLYAYMKTSQ